MSQPLNPSAVAYEPLYFIQPQPQPQPHQYFPFYHVVEPFVYPYTSFIHCHPYNTPNFIPCDRIKNDGQRVRLPPRLRKPRKDNPMDSKLVWLGKQDTKKTKPAGFPVNGDGSVVSADELDKFNGKTSIMIRNIPKIFKRIDLQSLLDIHCKTENEKAYETEGSRSCKSAYDFLYLPMDFGFDMNLGFAFMNFTTPVAAVRFYKAYNKRDWGCVSTRKKFCEVGVAKFQGKQLKEKFKESVFPCRTDEYLPLVFTPPRDGFNNSTPSLIGRRTRSSPKDRSVRVMTKRKMKKEAMNSF